MPIQAALIGGREWGACREGSSARLPLRVEAGAAVRRRSTERHGVDNRAPDPEPTMAEAQDTLHRLRTGQLTGATRLDLRAGLTAVPDEVFALADTLEILDLSGNAIDHLPPDLHRLRRLRVLFCSENRFTELPAVLGRCERLEMVGFRANRIARVEPSSLPPALRWLILTDNRIEHLPDAIGRCTGLRKLMLSGNRLQRLPDGLSGCRGLELLRAAANRLDSLPDWLLDLPALAWLGVGGNPVSASLPALAPTVSRPIASIPWESLDLAGRVGEGASGVLWRATWRCSGAAPLPVVVKLYKGALTSDGWAEDEIAACLRAGPHPNLVLCHGRIEGHPDGAVGLVMAPVDGAESLAAPPSLASCTRDVYPDASRFEWSDLRALAHGAAAALAHLHARGLLHGDLYAHNLLWNRESSAVHLCDFGAASVIPTDVRRRQAIERTDVRAFGHLLEELVQRLPSAQRSGEAASALMALVSLCRAAGPAQGLGMAEIEIELRRIVPAL
ncbi:MAG: protein kinase [Comamonadaceae bacterium]|nr:MAG: protein kinase [Comamonadaceae bacterium]